MKRKAKIKLLPRFDQGRRTFKLAPRTVEAIQKEQISLKAFIMVLKSLTGILRFS